VKLPRRQFLHFAAAAAALPAVSRVAGAQTYPSRPVRVIVPFGPGGPADVFARIMLRKLSDAVKQAFVVENRLGASTMIGTEVASKAAPDGHTLLVVTQTHAVNESLVAKKPFQLLRDFAPVAPIYVSSDLVMVVHKSVPVKNVKEFIALAKSKPGAMNYASSGVGSQYHLAGELFKTMTGTDIVHVPYKSSDGARNGILGGQVQMMFDSVSAMGPDVEAGLVQALGTSGERQSRILPNVPTIAQAGVSGFQSSGWGGLMAPAATPKSVIDRLNSEIRTILDSNEIEASWAKQGASAMSMAPDEFGAFVSAEVEKWGKVVRAANIKPE